MHHNKRSCISPRGEGGGATGGEVGARGMACPQFTSSLRHSGGRLAPLHEKGGGLICRDRPKGCIYPKCSSVAESSGEGSVT